MLMTDYYKNQRIYHYKYGYGTIKHINSQAQTMIVQFLSEQRLLGEKDFKNIKEV